MSRPYERKSNTLSILFFAIALLIAPPAIPLFVIFTAILYLLGAGIITNIVIIAFSVCAIGLFTGMQSALEQNFIHHVFDVFIHTAKNISVYNLSEVVQAYKIYTIFDWFIILCITMIISAIFVIIMINNKEKEQAGVIGYKAQIKRSNKKSNVNVKDKGTFIGCNSSNKKIYLSDKAKHVFVAGTTGAGKTVLLSNFVKNAINSNYGTLIIDGKGDIGENSLLEVTKKMCEEKNKKLYIIDMNNASVSDKYNPFKNANETIIKDMLINMSDWSEEHYKSNMERYVQRLVQLLLMKNKTLSFHEIIKYISPENFEMLSADLVKKEKITKEQHIANLELIQAGGKIAKDASARFSTIAESSVGEIFNENGIDITTAMTEKAVIIFVLNPLLYPETSRAMGRLVLIDSKKAVSNLFNTTDRKFFIFDEMNVYASTVLLDLVNKSRSANVTCFCASQSLADLESAVDESFKHQIIENCNNYFIMRQNSFKSAEECAKLIGTTERLKMTYQLSDTEATGKGSARRTREFIVHPDEIKSQTTGECVFVSRDNGICERIKVNKPF